MTNQAEINAHFSQLTTDGCNQPDAWLRTVTNLLSGAEAIMVMINAGRSLHGMRGRTEEEDRLASRAVQTGNQAQMLYAFAIECLFKAHYLKSGGILYVDGCVQKIPGVSASHDLLQLCDAVGLRKHFNKSQRTVLDRLTLWTEIGRYPAPLKSTRYGHKLLSNGWMYLRGVWTYQDEETLYEILGLLYAELGEEMPAYATILLEARQKQDEWMRAAQQRSVEGPH